MLHLTALSHSETGTSRPSPPLRSPLRGGLALAVALLASCAGSGGSRADDAATRGPQVATSLLREPLYAAPIAPERRERLESELDAARGVYEANPQSENAVIWYGRRLAYLGRYEEAIEVFTQGLVWHPRSSKLFRHRGHRHITLRQLDLAIHDLRRAADLMHGTADELEPDGAPNAVGAPRSTHQSNVWYHLGLAHYLRGQNEAALEAYRAALQVSQVNDDMLCATLHWLHMTLRRTGREAEAFLVLTPVTEHMDVIENRAYHRLLLMYRGQLAPEDVVDFDEGAIQSASAAYGVANAYWMNGETERAIQAFEQIVDAGAWAAFGTIAAEADLARIRAEQARLEREALADADERP